MAVATALALTSAAVSIAGGVHKTVQGAKQAKAAKRAADSYERQDLTNVYANLELPVESFRREEDRLAVNTASQINAASEAGSRGLGVALPGIQDYSTEAMAKIGDGLRESQFNIQKLIADDEARIQGLTEEREKADLEGIGALESAGEQTKASGFGDIVQGFGAATQIIGSSGKGDSESDDTSENGISSREKRLNKVRAGNGSTVGNFLRKTF